MAKDGRPRSLPTSAAVTHVVKLKLYTGGESIVRRCESAQEAQEAADALNAEYQANTYVVEPYDPEKAARFFGTHKRQGW